MKSLKNELGRLIANISTSLTTPRLIAVIALVNLSVQLLRTSLKAVGFIVALIVVGSSAVNIHLSHFYAFVNNLIRKSRYFNLGEI